MSSILFVRFRAAAWEPRRVFHNLITHHRSDDDEKMDF